MRIWPLADRGGAGAAMPALGSGRRHNKLRPPAQRSPVPDGPRPGRWGPPSPRTGVPATRTMQHCNMLTCCTGDGVSWQRRRSSPRPGDGTAAPSSCEGGGATSSLLKSPPFCGPRAPRTLSDSAVPRKADSVREINPPLGEAAEVCADPRGSRRVPRRCPVVTCGTRGPQGGADAASHQRCALRPRGCRCLHTASGF